MDKKLNLGKITIAHLYEHAMQNIMAGKNDLTKNPVKCHTLVDQCMDTNFDTNFILCDYPAQ